MVRDKNNRNPSQLPNIFDSYDSERQLRSILRERRIHGQTKGYFGATDPDFYAPTVSLAHICQDETYKDEEKNLVKLRNKRSEYGLVFKENKILDGAEQVRRTPSWHLKNETYLKLFMPFVDLDSAKYPYDWENEFRYKGNLDFEYEDVLFLICPKKEITKMESIFGIRAISLDDILGIEEGTLQRFVKLAEEKPLTERTVKLYSEKERAVMKRVFIEYEKKMRQKLKEFKSDRDIADEKYWDAWEQFVKDQQEEWEMQEQFSEKRFELSLEYFDEYGEIRDPANIQVAWLDYYERVAEYHQRHLE